MTNKTAHSETCKIDTLILRHAKDSFLDQDTLDENWKNLNYYGCPDFNKAIGEYNNFLDILKSHSDNIIFLPPDSNLSIDAIYVRDAMITTNKGIIFCNMGKEARRSEPKAAEKFLSENNISILGKISGDGKIEGGDLIWLDEKTLAVGRGYRTNDEGIRQLKKLTEDFVENLITVPLPHWLGENDVFHLMSIISPINRNLAVVYEKLLPVPFRELLLERNIELIDVPDDEFETMACNILALTQKSCLMLDGNPKTKNNLENHGITVFTYSGNEISIKGAGGPTCLTRPLIRKIV